MPRELASRVFLAALVLLLLNCRRTEHQPDEIYYLVSTNTKLPYWYAARARERRSHRCPDYGVRVSCRSPIPAARMIFSSGTSWGRSTSSYQPFGIMRHHGIDSARCVRVEHDENPDSSADARRLLVCSGSSTHGGEPSGFRLVSLAQQEGAR